MKTITSTTIADAKAMHERLFDEKKVLEAQIAGFQDALDTLSESYQEKEHERQFLECLNNTMLEQGFSTFASMAEVTTFFHNQISTKQQRIQQIDLLIEICDIVADDV